MTFGKDTVQVLSALEEDEVTHDHVTTSHEIDQAERIRKQKWQQEQQEIMRQNDIKLDAQRKKVELQRQHVELEKKRLEENRLQMEKALVCNLEIVLEVQ
jgi:hypothetical protein